MRKIRDVPTVLYIAGYGRSGSTVLDVLLGSSDQAVSVGELVYLGEEWQHDDRTCACGEDYEHCPFWKDVFSTREKAREWKRLARRVESRGRLLHLVSGSIPNKDRLAYRSGIRSLFSHIAERGSASVVVDSSKSARHAAGRFWALRNIGELDVRVLHLVRDGRSVLRSVLEKGSNWVAEGYRKEKRLLGGRTTMGWVVANSIAWGLGRSLGEDRYRRVKFEDLLRTPEKTLQEIGEFADIDVKPVIGKVSRDERFEIGHNVGGNRIRLNESIYFRQKDNPNSDPWRRLSMYHRLLFAVLGGYLNLKFEYRLL